VIVGDLPGQLEQAPFYRGGYSLLIAPLLELGSDPGFTYHLVLVLNAALAASVLPLLYLLLTRFGGVRSQPAFWFALAGAAYPALTVLSQTAISENLLFPLVCVWLLSIGGLLSRPDRRGELLWSAALATSTGALWAVHNRTIVALAVTVAVLVWMVARKRLRPAALGLALLLLALAVFGVHLLDDFLIDRNYAGSAPDELSERMDEIFTASGLRTVIANLVGQTWYLLTATFGLAAAVAFDFFRRPVGGEDADRPRPPVVAVLLALTALLLAISAVAFPERTRPDMLIYGRYVEIAAPPLIAFGLAALSSACLPFAPDSESKGGRAWSIAWPAAGLVALTALVVLIRVTSSDPNTPNRWNISSLPFITVQLGAAILIGAAVVAAAGGFLLLRASERGSGRLLGLLAVALFLPIVAYGAWNPVRSSQRAVYPGGWTSPEDSVPAGAAVSYDLDDYDTIGLYTLQWFLPNSEMTLFHGDRQPPPSDYAISSESWGRGRPGLGAERIWSAVGRDQVLWRLGEQKAR
jgi:hypothetical protein